MPPYANEDHIPYGDTPGNWGIGIRNAPLYTWEDEYGVEHLPGGPSTVAVVNEIKSLIPTHDFLGGLPHQPPTNAADGDNYLQINATRSERAKVWGFADIGAITGTTVGETVTAQFSLWLPKLENGAGGTQEGRFHSAKYRRRNVFERVFGWLEEKRRIATRYEKQALNSLGFLKIAAI